MLLLCQLKMKINNFKILYSYYESVDYLFDGENLTDLNDSNDSFEADFTPSDIFCILIYSVLEN